MAAEIGTINLAKVYGTLSASTSGSGTPVSNLIRPGLHLPWRSTVTTDSWIVIDLGAARNVDRIVLLHANFASVKIQQHTADSWGAPAYDSGTLTIARDPDQREYRRWADKGGAPPYTLRYTRLFIPAQTPVDGAAYFSLGSLWMGTVLASPRTPALRFDRARELPRVEARAEFGEWMSTYVSGAPFSQQRYTRQAEMRNPPGVNDEWAQWLAIDRAIEEAGGGPFCYIERSWGPTASPSGVWIMRQMNTTRWRLSWPLAEDEWELEEVVRP